MNVRVLFFGPLVDVTGAGAHALTLPDGASVRTLLESVFRLWPPLREREPNLLVAINLDYAGRDDVIPSGAEVAIMPPVQGG